MSKTKNFDFESSENDKNNIMKNLKTNHDIQMSKNKNFSKNKKILEGNNNVVSIQENLGNTDRSNESFTSLTSIRSEKFKEANLNTANKPSMKPERNRFERENNFDEEPLELTLRDIHNIFKTIIPESRILFEENLHLLEEIYSNAVLGWVSCGTMPQRFQRIDKEIILLSSYFFDMKPTIVGFQLDFDIITDNDIQNNEYLSKMMQKIDSLIRKVQQSSSGRLSSTILPEINKILTQLSNHSFCNYYQVLVAIIVKNIIDLLISIKEYYFNIDSIHKKNNGEQSNMNSKLFTKQDTDMSNNKVNRNEYQVRVKSPK